MKTKSIMLLSLLSKVLGGNPKARQIGDGAKRAEARLARKAKANKKTYAALPETKPSRQVLRAEARTAAKAHRSGVKQVAMREKWKGGAAVVR